MKKRQSGVARLFKFGRKPVVAHPRGAYAGRAEMQRLESRLLFSFNGTSTPDLAGGPVISTIDGSTGSTNGDIYVATQYDDGIGGYGIRITRFNSSGALDTGWGSSGNLQMPRFGTGTSDEDTPRAIAIDANGAQVAIVGGSTQIGWAVGTVSTGYNSLTGTDGRVDWQDSSFQSGEAEAVNFDHDGYLLIAGSNFGSNMVVARMNSNGGLDTGFNSTGIVDLYNTGTSAYATSVAQAHDNSHILVGGYTEYTAGGSSASDFTLVKLDSAGADDTSFGNYDSTHGTSRTNFASCNPNACVSYSTDAAYGLAEWDDSGTDYVYLGGATNANGNTDTAMARYKLSDGTLDTTWGYVNGNGHTGEMIGNSGYITGVVVSGSNVAVGGYGGGYFSVDAFQSNGNLDTGFQSTGQVSDQYGGSGSSDGDSLSYDSNTGELVVSGLHSTSCSGCSYDVGLAEYAFS